MLRWLYVTLLVTCVTATESDTITRTATYSLPGGYDQVEFKYCTVNGTAQNLLFGRTKIGLRSGGQVDILDLDSFSVIASIWMDLYADHMSVSPNCEYVTVAHNQRMTWFLSSAPYDVHTVLLPKRGPEEFSWQEWQVLATERGFAVNFPAGGGPIDSDAIQCVSYNGTITRCPNCGVREGLILQGLRVYPHPNNEWIYVSHMGSTIGTYKLNFTEDCVVEQYRKENFYLGPNAWFINEGFDLGMWIVNQSMESFRVTGRPSEGCMPPDLYQGPSIEGDYVWISQYYMWISQYNSTVSLLGLSSRGKNISILSTLESSPWAWTPFDYLVIPVPYVSLSWKNESLPGVITGARQVYAAPNSMVYVWCGVTALQAVFSDVLIKIDPKRSSPLDAVDTGTYGSGYGYYKRSFRKSSYDGVDFCPGSSCPLVAYKGDTVVRFNKQLNPVIDNNPVSVGGAVRRMSLEPGCHNAAFLLPGLMVIMSLETGEYRSHHVSVSDVSAMVYGPSAKIYIFSHSDTAVNCLDVNTGQVTRGINVVAGMTAFLGSDNHIYTLSSSPGHGQRVTKFSMSTDQCLRKVKEGSVDPVGQTLYKHPLDEWVFVDTGVVLDSDSLVPQGTVDRDIHEMGTFSYFYTSTVPGRTVVAEAGKQYLAAYRYPDKKPLGYVYIPPPRCGFIYPKQLYYSPLYNTTSQSSENVLIMADSTDMAGIRYTTVLYMPRERFLDDSVMYQGLEEMDVLEKRYKDKICHPQTTTIPPSTTTWHPWWLTSTSTQRYTTAPPTGPPTQHGGDFINELHRYYHIGYIFGGVIAGVSVIVGIGLVLWFTVCRRKYSSPSHQRLVVPSGDQCQVLPSGDHPVSYAQGQVYYPQGRQVPYTNMTPSPQPYNEGPETQHQNPGGQFYTHPNHQDTVSNPQVIQTNSENTKPPSPQHSTSPSQTVPHIGSQTQVISPDGTLLNPTPPVDSTIV